MKKDLALIWMSSGNSYFNNERIKKLLKYAEHNFDKIIILSPDKPAEHNFRALGYEETKLKRKARQNSNRLLHKAKRILEKSKNKNKFKIENWENIEKEIEYQIKLKEIKKLYLKNKEFKKDIQSLSKKALGNKSNTANIDEAALYLIEEFAFVLASPKIYDSENSSYLYHKKLEVSEKLLSGKYDNIKRKNIFFKVTGIL
jgi:tRNA-dependent cyclodipeptide synthase